MPRIRPATNPLSFHKHTGQYYVTRNGKRTYLGTDRQKALDQYHRFNLGLSAPSRRAVVDRVLAAKELANRFLAAQQANWRVPEVTLPAYKAWLKRFLEDHPGLVAADFTVEMFAKWKLSLRSRGYAAETINHFLSAVRAIFSFAADTGLLESAPRLRRVRNECCPQVGSKEKPLYSRTELRKLLDEADEQMQVMLLLGLNCGFGPKDLHDLRWDDIRDGRVRLARSKTGICQTFALWPESEAALGNLREIRARLMARIAKRSRFMSDCGHVFVTRYWKPWKKDAVTHEFRKLCVRAGVPCYGIYRLRHCASTAISLVATPHVHRRFMRHSQIKTQVGYTHTPDSEVDNAVMQTRSLLLEKPTSDSERNQEPQEVGAKSTVSPAGQNGGRGSSQRPQA